MKRLAALIGAAAITSMTAGCALFSRDAPTEVAALPGSIEPIHAAAVAQDQAVFWVSSNGCTAKADLTPVVRAVGDGSTITLRRIKEDRCDKPVAEGVEMRWTFEEMGLSPGANVSIENPYQMPVSLALRPGAPG